MINNLNISSNNTDNTSNNNKIGGLRTRGILKNNSKDNPLVTIITVVLNNSQFLENTIKSVLNQTYGNIEYIIIDGGSTDIKTLQTIKLYENNIDYWISEPDKGIYDAMNKGAKLSRGSYLHFLNADDSFFDNELIEHIITVIKKTNYHIIYGDVLMFNRSKKFGYIRSSNINKLYFLYKGIPQQAFFIKKSLLDEIGSFDINFKIVSDLDFLLKALNNKEIKIKYLDSYPIVVFNIGGASSNIKLLKQEREVIIKKYYSVWERFIFTNKYFEKLICNNELRYRENKLIRLITKLYSKWLLKK
ncbi:MAG: glycosyltransferase family 2 protein [Bacteroidales bacterium]